MDSESAACWDPCGADRVAAMNTYPNGGSMYWIATDNPRVQGATITSGLPQACRWAKERSAAVPSVTFTVHQDGTRREGYFTRDGDYVPGPRGAGHRVADYRDGKQVRSY